MSLFQLISLFTFGFAVVDMRILKQYGSERAVGTFAGDVIIVAASLMLVAIAIFGCVGAARENVKILYLVVYPVLFTFICGYGFHFRLMLSVVVT